MRLFLESHCWDAIQHIPREVQERFKELCRQIMEASSGPESGLLREIPGGADQSMCYCQLGEGYRVIVGIVSSDSCSPLYVGEEQESMEWARERKFCWNRQIGAFQVITLEQPHATEQASEAEQGEPILSAYSDDQLLRIGVPEENLPLVRAIRDYDDLERCETTLPPEAWESLFYLMDSGDIDRIIADIEEGKSETTDREHPLLSENNRRHYIDITSDEELERVLSGDLQQWMLFLHPSQRRLVEGDFSGSLKVSGGGGTGKTVAAIHRLRHLCTTTYEGEGRVLYTAYNRALVDNLAPLIRRMEVPEERYHLETIDTLIRQIAREAHLVDGWTILFDSDSRLSRLWQEVEMDSASPFSAAYLQTEYEEVILYHDVSSLEEYLRTPRLGMGSALSRKQRRSVWEMVTKYRERSEEQRVISQRELCNRVTRHLREEGLHPYTHVIADEIQDLSNPELRLLRALTPVGPNDLFLVGDPYQRIYSRKLNFKSCGIQVQGRSKRLRVNYRTTEEIKRRAVDVVSGIRADDFDGGEESLKGYVSLLHGDAPVYRLFDNTNQEMDAIGAYIHSCLDAGIAPAEICVASYLRQRIDSIASSLALEYGIDCSSGRGSGEPERECVRVSTFHSMKGLEFRVVILAGVSATTMPYHPNDYGSWTEEERERHDREQRSLMYVALTRAISQVLITGCGQPSPFLTTPHETQL